MAKEPGIARARDFDNAGAPRANLRRLQDQRFLVRTGRGLFSLPMGMVWVPYLAVGAQIVDATIVTASEQRNFDAEGRHQGRQGAGGV